jgi:hypothetical protein
MKPNTKMKNRKEALKWWRSLSEIAQAKYAHKISIMSSSQIERIWEKEKSNEK